MTTSAQVKSYSIAAVSAPSIGLRIHQQGLFFRIVETTSAVTIEAFNMGVAVGRFEAVEQGLAVENLAFDELHITSDNGASQSIVLAISRDSDVTIEDSRPTVNATISTPIEPADTITSSADVTVTDGGGAILLLALDTDRKEAIISLASDEPVGSWIRVGPSGLLAGQGVKLQPGTTLIIALEGALYARNDSGAGSVDVNITSLSRP